MLGSIPLFPCGVVAFGVVVGGGPVSTIKKKSLSFKACKFKVDYANCFASKWTNAHKAVIVQSHCFKVFLKLDIIKLILK